MNELQLYELLKNVFSNSPIINGRFYILDGYGQDLNASGLNDVLNPYIEQDISINKYPLVGMLPPIEVPAGDYFNKFRTTFFFVTQQFESNGINNPNSLNSSSHPVRYDWQDMRTICQDFINVMNDYISNNFLLGTISLDNNSIFIRRFSNQNTDRLAGVQLNIDIMLKSLLCEDNLSFDIDAIMELPIPSNPHILHKH